MFPSLNIINYRLTLFAERFSHDKLILPYLIDSYMPVTPTDHHG